MIPSVIVNDVIRNGEIPESARRAAREGRREEGYPSGNNERGRATRAAPLMLSFIAGVVRLPMRTGARSTRVSGRPVRASGFRVGKSAR